MTSAPGGRSRSSGSSIGGSSFSSKARKSSWAGGAAEFGRVDLLSTGQKATSALFEVLDILAELKHGVLSPMPHRKKYNKEKESKAYRQAIDPLGRHVELV